jgi:hypothetical protein
MAELVGRFLIDGDAIVCSEDGVSDFERLHARGAFEGEGSTVQVAAGYSPDEYRLLGKISGQAPFSGVLVHHGWKTISTVVET